jgi:Mor family transcriptional regulator
MGQWSCLKPLDAEYILGNYGKKTVQQIATDLNATTNRVRRALKMNGIEMMGKSAMYSSIKELKFEYEDSLCDDHINGLNQLELSKKYKIGSEKVRFILDRNNIDRSKGRGSASVKAWASGRRQPRNCNKGGTKDIHNALIGRWKANAKSRNYPFTISIDSLQELLKKQDFRCAYTGIPMLCPKNFNEKREMTKSPYLISLDRIDNEYGYVDGNVHFVCVCINKAKGSYPHQEFIDIISKIKRQV